jgi:hypothetical protein
MNDQSKLLSHTVYSLGLKATGSEKEVAIYTAAYEAFFNYCSSNPAAIAAAAKAILDVVTIDDTGSEETGEFSQELIQSLVALQQSSTAFTVVGYHNDGESNATFAYQVEAPTAEMSISVVSKKYPAAVVLGVSPGHCTIDQIFSYSHDFTLDSATVLALPDAFGDGTEGQIINE